MPMPEKMIAVAIAAWLKDLYDLNVSPAEINLQKTKKEFEGDLTVNVFPFISKTGGHPEKTASELGEHLSSHLEIIRNFNVIKGFLNLLVEDSVWNEMLKDIAHQEQFGLAKKNSGKTIMIEFSSPNTNKPLHLGHVRNNLLGWSLAEILKACGHKVIRTQIINDRGIHICKSMLAWLKWGKGETPESLGIKGDMLVGKYYVEFEKHYKADIQKEIAGGATEEEAAANSMLMKEAREMLLKWEAKDPEVFAIWQKMNGWVYEGFEKTYRELGIDFDKLYYESDTYLRGKKVVLDALEKGIFYRKEDGSVWCDLSSKGLDEKLLLRTDGTAVYMTQDIGTAIIRFEDFNLDKSIYVVGNEQDYHFKILVLILKKLGFKLAENCLHLSYGMVDLPGGKMKSREGTVVDADDLLEEMTQTAAKATNDLGKTDDFSPVELDILHKSIGLGALKYFILKVEPKKRMLFNPEESIDLNGNTGPFLQYTHARIRSLLNKASAMEITSHSFPSTVALLPQEKETITILVNFPDKIRESGDTLNPAIIANYLYDLAKSYNHFYQKVPVLKEKDHLKLHLRLMLSEVTAMVLRSGLRLLGISAPERM